MVNVSKRSIGKYVSRRASYSRVIMLEVDKVTFFSECDLIILEILTHIMNPPGSIFRPSSKYDEKYHSISDLIIKGSLDNGK
jgi:hypothetical protein